MEKLKPIFRYTLTRDNDAIEIRMAEISKYKYEKRGFAKAVYSYRDKHTNSMRDIKIDRMDTVCSNVVYSYSNDVEKAKALFVAKFEEDIALIKEELERKTELLTEIKEIKPDEILIGD